MSASVQLCEKLCRAVCIVLNEAREEAGLSLTEVARRAGLNRQAVTFIERDERTPRIDSLIRIALALDIRPSELWIRAEKKMPLSVWKAPASRGKS